MNLEELRQKAGDALKGQRKEQVRDAVHGAMALVEANEKNRLAWQGKAEAAEQAARIARGELEASERELQSAVKALRELIGEV